MNILNDVVTLAEGNEIIGRNRTYLNDMIASGNLQLGLHYREAGRVKLVLKSVCEKIRDGKTVKLEGRAWGDLEEYEKEFLLSRCNCVDGITGENATSGDCIVDLTDRLSVNGTLIDDELVIDDESVIYCPIA